MRFIIFCGSRVMWQRHVLPQIFKVISMVVDRKAHTSYSAECSSQHSNPSLWHFITIAHAGYCHYSPPKGTYYTTAGGGGVKKSAANIIYVPSGISVTSRGQGYQLWKLYYTSGNENLGNSLLRRIQQ